MISGLVLKYLNGECFIIRRGYETARPVSSSFCLTVPPARMTAFVTVESEDTLEDALVDMNKWSLKVVLPIRSKYKHDNLMIDADLIASISK